MARDDAKFGFGDDATGSEIISEIDTALNVLAGLGLPVDKENWAPSYAANLQPADATKLPEDSSMIFNAPGGQEIKSAPNIPSTPNMSAVISSLLGTITPIISNYLSYILPIVAIIIALLEIICCLLNPFCVIPAVSRFLSKWIPVIISLVPPIASAPMIRSMANIIGGIITFMLVEVAPIAKLIASNIDDIKDAVQSLPKATNVKDLEPVNARLDGIKDKMQVAIQNIINRLGILAVARPVFQMLMSILGMFVGLPCSDSPRGAKIPYGSISGYGVCCGSLQCPEDLEEENLPAGICVIEPYQFAGGTIDSVYQIVPVYDFKKGYRNNISLSSPTTNVRSPVKTGNPEADILKMPYFQNLEGQLNVQQFEEPLNFAKSIGSVYDDIAYMRVKFIINRLVFEHYNGRGYNWLFNNWTGKNMSICDGGLYSEDKEDCSIAILGIKKIPVRLQPGDPNFDDWSDPTSTFYTLYVFYLQNMASYNTIIESTSGSPLGQSFAQPYLDSAKFAIGVYNNYSNWAENKILIVISDILKDFTDMYLAYKAVPNFPLLVGGNIVGVGCVPDVRKEREKLEEQFSDKIIPLAESVPELIDLEPKIFDPPNDVIIPALERALEIATLPALDLAGYVVLDADGNNITDTIPSNEMPPIPRISVSEVPEPVDDDTWSLDAPWEPIEEEPEEVLPPVVPPSAPPGSRLVPAGDYYKERIADEFNIVTDTLIEMQNSLNEPMLKLVKESVDALFSELDVDKNVVLAGTEDKAIVSVTPRTIGRDIITKGLLDGNGLDIEILTDFGTLRNKKLNSVTGIYTAELVSALPGEANIMAKVNGEFIEDIRDDVNVLAIRHVRFVADHILPTRRIVSTPSQKSKVTTTTITERGPRKR